MAKRFSSGQSAGGDAHTPGREWAWGLALVVAVIVAYLPVWRAGFIWDDETILTRNPCIVGSLGLKELWTTQAADICPFTLTTFWAEHKLWGLAPLPYHVVNVFLQAACAVLLWRVLLRMEVPGAWFGAALWALHPAQVESVAWISEMKNTESGFFFLLTIFFFLRDRTGLSLLFAALAMTSKTSTVILPVVLLLCVWWRKGSWDWNGWIKIAPMFVLSLICGLLSIWTQKPSPMDNPRWAESWPQRLATAGDAIWFYLGKLLWPHPLTLIYPRWQIDAAAVFAYAPLLAALLLTVLLWWWRNSWARPFLFAWGYFLIALFPALGLLHMSYASHSLVADHFQYLAGMGPLALAGAGAARMAEIKGSLIWAAGGALLLILSFASWNRSRLYLNDETIWTDTLARNPSSWTAHNNLGRILVDRGELDAASAHAHASLQVNPNSAEAYNILGIAASKEGRAQDAVGLFQEAIQREPKDAEAFTNLGNVYAQQGKTSEALASYQKSLEFNPSYILAYIDAGAALEKKGRSDEAIAAYGKALAIDPANAEAHHNLGNALLHEGRIDDAVAEYRKALAARPDYVDAHRDLAYVYIHTNHLEEAKAELEKTVTLDPGNASFRNAYGIALARSGEKSEALTQFQEAVRLQPNFPEAQKNLTQARAAIAQGAAK
jgi:tetratricopeptide (TPR) repeat protein